MRLNTDTLEIGSFILEKLDNIISTYPIVADSGASYPFCLYRRIGFKGNDSKDIYNHEETVNIEIIIAATTYKESIKLAEKVKDTLEKLRGEWRNTVINHIIMDNSNEDFSSDAYLQKLYFTISLDNKGYRNM